MAEPTLYTFPPSLDSEFSRFVLHHYGFTAREERHVILFQSVVTLLRAGTPRIPTLTGADHGALDTVVKIINFLERQAPPERRLLAGVDPTAMTADWKLFHRVMQTATTAFPYYHLLPREDLMVRALSEGAPAAEVRAVTQHYPVFRFTLHTLLRLSPQRAEQAKATIRSVLDDVDRRLSDGRRFLGGDRFSLHDLAFTISAAPVIWPASYGGPLPPLQRTPLPIQELVAECRARPAGQFATRIYDEYRGPEARSPAA